MFTCSFDNRYKLPNYFKSHMAFALAHTNLHLITPARPFRSGPQLHNHSLSGKLKVLNPDCDPWLQATIKAFDSVFINLSTNHASFERSCFIRWFAINSFSAHLSEEDYICTLDTDLLLMSTPESHLSHFEDHHGISNLDFMGFISESAGIGIVVPALLIVKKRVLNEFCEYLLTYYFSDLNRNRLLSCFFRQVGKREYGGISDMTAWHSFLNSSNYRIANIAEVNHSLFIDNFNNYISDCQRVSPSFLFNCRSFSSSITLSGVTTPITAIHFQGNAKVLMNEWLHSDGPKVITSEYIELVQSKLSQARPALGSRLFAKMLGRAKIFLKTGDLID